MIFLTSIGPYHGFIFFLIILMIYFTSIQITVTCISGIMNFIHAAQKNKTYLFTIWNGGGEVLVNVNYYYFKDLEPYYC